VVGDSEHAHAGANGLPYQLSRRTRAVGFSSVRV
jgi:hypothetical protein